LPAEEINGAVLNHFQKGDQFITTDKDGLVSVALVKSVDVAQDSITLSWPGFNDDDETRKRSTVPNLSNESTQCIKDRFVVSLVKSKRLAPMYAKVLVMRFLQSEIYQGTFHFFFSQYDCCPEVYLDDLNTELELLTRDLPYRVYVFACTPEEEKKARIQLPFNKWEFKRQGVHCVIVVKNPFFNPREV